MVSITSAFRALKAKLKPATLTTRLAEPQDSGPRTIVRDDVASGLRPEKLARILREAVEGDPAEFFALAEDMEERDPHYGSVLGTRKLALMGIEPEINAASDDPRDVEIADMVRSDLLAHAGFGFLIGDLLDALGKGVAVVEVLWNTDGPRWVPDRFERVEPGWLTFDRRTRSRVLLKADGGATEELLPYRYVVHTPRIKSGIPIRGGLARLAVWSFLLKSYTIKDWAAFCEIFGQPLRLGKYHAGASDQDKRALLRAVRSIARDAAAIIPATMEMELVQAKTSGGPVFKDFAEYLDGQISKAVLGQTMTSDDGSSLAQAEVHDEVRGDILKADGRQLAFSLNRDLVIPYCLINFGPLERYPVLKIEPDEPEDLNLEAQILERLVGVGLQVSARQVRDKFGYAEPDSDSDRLGSPPQVGAEVQSDPVQARAAGSRKTALNREHLGHDHGADNLLDGIAREALSDFRPLLDPVLEPVMAALERASSLEEFGASLADVLTAQNMGPLTDALAAATLKARGLGEGLDERGHG